MQHLISIISLSAIYLLIAYSFLLMYMAVKFFNIAHAAIIAIGGYLFFLFSKQLTVDIWISVALTLLISGILGALIFHFIYKPLLKRKTQSLVYLVVSLGIYVVLFNIISIIWSDGTKSIRPNSMDKIYPISDAFIADFQLYSIIISISIFSVFIFFIKKSRIGKKYIAASENETLSEIFGINSNIIQYHVFAIASILGAIVGILYGFDTDLTPGIGFQILLYGIIVMIIGGVGSNWGLVLSAFLLATAQHFGAFYFDSKWMEAIAFIILILFLIWKPLGFSGKRLKKVEI